MEEIKIIGKYIDDREFRNYVHAMFYLNNFKYLTIDDARVSDEYPENNNDLKVTKDGIRYTVQTYRNGIIRKKAIQETLDDMKKEKLEHGIIVTNYNVCKKTKTRARKQNIIILDKAVFVDGIYE